MDLFLEVRPAEERHRCDGGNIGRMGHKAGQGCQEHKGAEHAKARCQELKRLGLAGHRSVGLYAPRSQGHRDTPGTVPSHPRLRQR